MVGSMFDNTYVPHLQSYNDMIYCLLRRMGWGRGREGVAA